MGGPNLAVLDGASSGLRFGPEGLTVNLQAGLERQAKSRLGSYYAKLPDGGRSLFAPSEKTKTDLTSLKVQCHPSDVQSQPCILLEHASIYLIVC